MNVFGRKEKVSLVFIGFLVLCNFFVWQELFDLADQNLEVVFFDVGQGDAIFIETPQRHQILIDGGGDTTILEKLAKELPFWDKSIDLVILTHPERDHLGGLIEVLKRYKVDYIIWTGVVREAWLPEYTEWKDLIKEEKAKIVIAKKGQRIKVGKVWLSILYPFENLEGKEFKVSNHTSIVASLVFSDISFLFTGDITSKVELKLVAEDINLKSEVLKVAHHGSKYSSTLKFLEAVDPEIAVIQVGKNPYGHPTTEALQRLKKFAKVLRTDEDGDIKIVSDGNKFKISKIKF